MNNNSIGLGIADILRFFSLSVVNVLGVIFPGILFILFSILTIIWPIFILLFDITNYYFQSQINWDGFFTSLYLNKGILIALTILFSYWLGYLLRLYTVDRLDSISADFVLSEFAKEHKTNIVDAAKIENWPYRKEKFDKFPYLHLKEYLKKRGLIELADLVTWENVPFPNKGIQRSKKIIDNYKLEVTYKSPMLASIIEANEAHIRFLYGTWQVAGIFVNVSVVSLIITIIIFILNLINLLPIFANVEAHYFVIILIQIILLFSLLIAKIRIQKLFHYQRVKELVQILNCTYFARTIYQNGHDNKTSG